MLERDERESFQRKDEILRTLAFRPGERVADIGAGSGYFAIPIARAVGPEGIVWATDFVQEMLDFIGRRIAIEGLANVRLVRTPREDPRPPEGNLDTILLSDVLHYIPDRVPLLRSLNERLRPGGRMVVLDFTPRSMEERPWGPAPDQQVSREDIEREMREAGLRLHAAYDFLPEQHFTVHVRD
jgi:ubiquinone/menaquinone biosynthesis C-methylase UbiE